MDPFTQAMILQGGAGILGGIGSYLGGGQDRKDQGRGRQMLQSQYGQDIFDPKVLGTMKRNSFRSNIAPMAAGADRRFGLDSGRASNEMMRQYGNQEGDWLAQAMMQNASMKSLRDTGIASQFYQRGR